jgi:translation initiation factor IF-2
LATAIIRQGTLKVGDYVLAGTSWAKVKRMTDDRGNVVTSAGPSIPVEIVGWKDLPVVGDVMLACDSEVHILYLSLYSREFYRKRNHRHWQGWW